MGQEFHPSTEIVRSHENHYSMLSRGLAYTMYDLTILTASQKQFGLDLLAHASSFVMQSSVTMGLERA